VNPRLTPVVHRPARLHRRVKGFPAVERLDGGICEPFDVVAAAGVDVGVVVRRMGPGAAVPAGQVQQRPPHLRGRERHDRPRCLAAPCHVAQCVVQSQGGLLEHVVGIVVAVDLGKPPQHPPGQQSQPRAAPLENSFPGRQVPGGEAGDTLGQGCVVIHGHRLRNNRDSVRTAGFGPGGRFFSGSVAGRGPGARQHG